MEAFSAVVTTGIYCRPGCSARPRAENVRTFPLAASAEWASPRALRERRRANDRLVADGGLRLRLPFLGPLDWDAMVADLGARAIPGVEYVSGVTYRRTIVIDGDPGVLELLPGGDDHLILRAHLPHWEELIHVVARARRIASLDFDLEEPASRLAQDPTVGPLLKRRPGLRPPLEEAGGHTGREMREILTKQGL